jgi:N-acetylglutamate synthase-like GNAT family acetyltransferase
MEIRKAIKKDARKISMLRRKTLKEINKNDYLSVFLDFLIDENSTQGILNKMRDREIFCMWEGDTLLGTIDLKENKIMGLFIKSSEIGKGIGTKLMDFIEKHARSKKIKQVRLYSTKFALSFYKKRGYYLVLSGYWVIGKFKSKDRVMVKNL